MIAEDHLVSTFYISRPHSQPPDNFPTEESFEEKPPDQPFQQEIKPQKTVKLGSAAPVEDPNFSKIFNMIKRQVNPSAEVKVKPYHKKKQRNVVMRSTTFLKQFQQFFSGFIIKGQFNAQLFTNRHNDKKKTKRKLTRFSPENSRDVKQEEAQDQQVTSQMDEDAFANKKESKLSYHERLKRKISNKINDIKQLSCEKRMHKVEMGDLRFEGQMDGILRSKSKCNKAPPKLKIIRSGLPISITEIDHKTKNSHQGFAENRKAKKDQVFFNTLQKNCEVVLSDINNYENCYRSKKISRHKSFSKVKPRNHSYMKDTCSHSFKRNSMALNTRKSQDDKDFSRWKAQFMQIDDKSRKNLKKSRQLSSGLKVFESYCNFVDSRWNQDQQRIQKILAEQVRPQAEFYIYTTN